MTSSRYRTSLLIWTGWLLVTIVLRQGPTSLVVNLRAGFREVTGVALAVCEGSTARVREYCQRWQLPQSTDAKEFAQLQAENRVLQSLVVDLQQQVQRSARPATPPADDQSSALTEVVAVDAAVIGVQGDALRSNQRMLVSLGKREGLLGEELVLQGEGVLLDRGTDFGLTSDQLVTAGKQLFGRTMKSGKWTTLVQPVTDAEFRMAARIIRISPLGPVLGPRGVLAGTGGGCRLEEVGATEAVAPGDYVYTDPLAAPHGEPIYIGRIRTANVSATATQWTIDVDPAAPAGEVPSRLQVLRVNFSANRQVGILRERQ
ncbi:rod shape-determining protein MreC [Planctomicrobium sp. SH664]|uniref:rod shape-determining protein MreC n=1 Tax=Planctomicrobium sp. SH664 TaxID=3448125 RepID=UPI003F5BE8CB